MIEMTSFHVGFLFLFLVIVPMVKFLREHLEKYGCVLGDKFIKAVRCNKKIGGGYTRGHGVFNCIQYLFNCIWSFFGFLLLSKLELLHLYIGI